MKLHFFAATAITLTILSSCGSGNSGKTTPIIHPVNVYKTESLGVISRDFAGIVTAENYTNLAFTVPGQVLKLNVEDGQKVQKGDIIASLDPRDYQLKVDVSKAELQTMELQQTRNQKLFEKQAVSKQDYEIAQTNYVRAKANYDNACYMLNDTKLKAPFSGIIEKKLIENYQTISVGQTIVKLVDPKVLNVLFTLPENSINLLSLPDKKFAVEFDNYKGEFVDAKLKEYVEASSDGSGVPVTLSLNFNREKFKNVNPGFSCLVSIKIQNPGYESVCAVPLSAVFNKPEINENFVWTVKDSKVYEKKVSLGQLFGSDMIIIEKGLTPGEDVVTAGVYQLVEGQEVNIKR